MVIHLVLRCWYLPLKYKTNQVIINFKEGKRKDQYKYKEINAEDPGQL